MRTLWLLPLLALGCANITPIEDGKAHGPLVTIKDLFTSCYLLEAGDQVILFDACWREGTLRRALEARGLAPEQVTHVLMTHGHADHTGGLALLENAQLYAFEGEQANLSEHAGADGEIDRVLLDGETLVFGEQSVQVLAVPGHSPGSAVFVVGDVVILGDVGLFDSDGQLTTVPEDRSEDPEEAARALAALAERLRALGVRIEAVVPAHSGAGGL